MIVAGGNIAAPPSPPSPPSHLAHSSPPLSQLVLLTSAERPYVAPIHFRHQASKPPYLLEVRISYQRKQRDHGVLASLTVL